MASAYDYVVSDLKLLSSAAYHAIRTSGFITLPSEITLRDYTNYIKSVPDYQKW